MQAGPAAALGLRCHFERGKLAACPFGRQAEYPPQGFVLVCFFAWSLKYFLSTYRVKAGTVSPFLLAALAIIS